MGVPPKDWRVTTLSRMKQRRFEERLTVSDLVVDASASAPEVANASASTKSDESIESFGRLATSEPTEQRLAACCSAGPKDSKIGDGIAEQGLIRSGVSKDFFHIKQKQTLRACKAAKNQTIALAFFSSHCGWEVIAVRRIVRDDNPCG